jgi:hypothetical protein
LFDSCAGTNLQSISREYQIIEKKQMQDFMKLYSGLVERCFNTCITDFTSKALTGREVSLENLLGVVLVQVETLNGDCLPDVSCSAIVDLRDQLRGQVYET